MVDYAKPWLSIDEQIDKLTTRGLRISDRAEAAKLLGNVGYYRLTGYLYPFRTSEPYLDEAGRTRTRVLSRYREETLAEDAARFIGFDRELRLLVLEGVELIEIALRTRIGHTLGRLGAFAHEDHSTCVTAFTESRTEALSGRPSPSRLEEWLTRVHERRDSSDEAFVAHFRTKYEDQMPIWALTELQQFGSDNAIGAASAADPPAADLIALKSAAGLLSFTRYPTAPASTIRTESESKAVNAMIRVSERAQDHPRRLGAVRPIRAEIEVDESDIGALENSEGGDRPRADPPSPRRPRDRAACRAGRGCRAAARGVGCAGSA